MKAISYVHLVGSMLILLIVEACNQSEQPEQKLRFRLKKIVDASLTEEYTYTKDGLLKQISLLDTKTNQKLISGECYYQYDSAGRLLRFDHALSNDIPRLYGERGLFLYSIASSTIVVETQVAFNRPDNFITSLRDSLIYNNNRLTQRYEFDYFFSRGYQAQPTLQRHNQYTYDPNGQLVHVETKVYDLTLSPLKPTFLRRNIITYEYDGRPNPGYQASRQDPLQHSQFISSFKYNVTRRIFQTDYSEEGPSKNQPIVTDYRYTYRADGLPEKRTDSFNHEIQFEYEEY